MFGKLKFYASAAFMPMFLGFAAPAQAQNPAAPKTEFHGLSRFIADAVVSDGAKPRHDYDLPNFIGTLKTGPWTIRPAIKFDNADPSHAMRDTDLRLFFLTASRNFKGGWKTLNGLFTPFDLLGTYDDQMEQTFPLPSLDRKHILRGGVTASLLQKTMTVSKNTSVIAAGGLGWKIPAINKNFGAENGPGYTTTPSTFSKVALQNKFGQTHQTETGFQHLGLAAGSSGKSQHEFYTYAKSQGNIGKARYHALLDGLNTVNCQGENCSSTFTLSAIAYAVTPLTAKFDIRGGFGLVNREHSVDAQIIGRIGKGIRVSVGAGKNLSTGNTILSAGLSHSF